MSRFLMGTLVGLSVVFVLQLGGTAEGRLLPVMGQLALSDPTPMDGAESRVSWRGRALKLRNCDFVRVEWFLGPRNGRRVQVEVEFTDAPQVRAPGQLDWQSIVIGLDVQSTLFNSYGDVLHRCPWRPWLTRTRFYTAPMR